MARVNFACRMARFRPIQFLAPRPNGMKPSECLAALATPPLKRRGLNSFASFPHKLWSWWTAKIGIKSSVPPGILYPPSSTSVLDRRIIAIVGGYNRRDSFRIMVSCTPDHTQLGFFSWLEYSVQKLKMTKTVRWWSEKGGALRIEYRIMIKVTVSWFSFFDGKERKQPMKQRDKTITFLSKSDVWRGEN